MENLHHELTVLSKAVSYKNLSSAAENIGLSQPQISRIVARVEESLEINLLDRGSRRNATWTKTALELADVYKQGMLNLSKNIQQVVYEQVPKYIQVACLEGLIPYATSLCNSLLCNSELEKLEANVFDLSLLEERFLGNKIDITLTSRLPGRKKYKHAKLVGYQSMNTLGSDKDFEVLSTFQHNQRSARLFKNKGPEGKTLVSNSLEIRRQWLSKYGGKGSLPSSIYFQRREEPRETPVYILAQDDFHPELWQMVYEFNLENLL